MARGSFDGLAPAIEPRCLRCGYCLVGLPTATCPECGKRFDLADAKSFDNGRRTKCFRRIFRKALVYSFLALIVASLVPQGIWKGELAFTCVRCRQTTVVKRWQPIAPSWLQVRYPGLHWTSVDPNDSRSSGSCSNHQFSVLFRNELWHTRFASSVKIPEIAVLRDLGATRLIPENANGIMAEQIGQHLALMVNRPSKSRSVRRVPFGD